MEDKIEKSLENQNPWWFDKDFDSGISRLENFPDIDKYMKTREILLLVGARRTGKSTLMFQLIRGLLNINNPKSILFINLDEPFFQTRSDEPRFLSDLIYGYASANNLKYVFIDEIQNYKYWAETLKAIYDIRRDFKVIISGSTSNLLHSTISARLSGRFFHVDVFPLSFQEFMNFKNIKKPDSIKKKNLFIEYLRFGSFPRIVLERDESIKQDFLKNYFQTIYIKDIVYVNSLRNKKEIFDLLYFLISNVGKLFSYNKVSDLLGIADKTIKEYIEYSKESFLVYDLLKYDKSVKKQIINQKKIYCLDTGLVNAVSFRFSEDKGRLLENLVFVNLISNKKEVFYHKGSHECDFVVKKGLRITEAIQVCLSLRNDDTKKREIKGILEAMEEHKLKEGLILTEDEKDSFVVDKKKIIVKPVYEWLIE